jgi:Right handed beta helix region
MELLAVLALLALFALLPVTASADAPITTITVNETTDSPLAPAAKLTACESEAAGKGCTLRAAVELANEESKEFSNIVTVEVPGETFNETLGTLTIEDGAQVLITGAGAAETIIAGNRSGAVVDVSGGTLTVRGVTIRDGEDSGVSGGGISAEEFSTLTVEASGISENEAENGGGVFAGYDAVVTIDESTIEHNRAESEGGGVWDAGAEVVVERSKIEDNEADWGGGIGASVGSGGSDCESGAPRPNVRGGAAAALAFDEHSLTVEQSTIEGNTAEAGNGGGVYIWHGYDDDCGVKASAHHAATKDLRPDSSVFEEEEEGLTIDQSTISHNSADVVVGEGYGGEGGGIYEEGEDIGDPIVNSTIADNVAQSDGGGVGVGYGGTAVLVSDTVFGNTVEASEVDAAKVAKPAVEELAAAGNNLAADPYTYGLIELRNTIVAEPSSATENCEGEIESYVPGAGYNLDYPSSTEEGSTTDTCGLSTEDHDLVGVSPGLEEAGLQENGGPTQTIALLSSSPAIGVVPLAEDCAETSDGPASIDQRGEPRPGIVGDGCDIGAYEYQGTKAPETKTSETKTSTSTSTTTTTTTATTPAPATGVLPFKAATPKLCSSLRRLTIHIQNVKQFGIASAVIEIDGHHKRTLRGKHLSAPINLVGLPLGTYTVEIVAHLRDGRTLRGERVYHTCVPKKPGHAYLPL